MPELVCTRTHTADTQFSMLSTSEKEVLLGNTWELWVGWKGFNFYFYVLCYMWASEFFFCLLLLLLLLLLLPEDLDLWLTVDWWPNLSTFISMPIFCGPPVMDTLIQRWPVSQELGTYDFPKKEHGLQKVTRLQTTTYYLGMSQSYVRPNLIFSTKS